MFGHMFNFGFGNNLILMIIYGVVQIGLVIGGIYLIVRLINDRNRKGHVKTNSAEEILKERYARGDINEEEYLRKMKLLKE